MVSRVCPICGDQFEKTSNVQIYCSRKCYNIKDNKLRKDNHHSKIKPLICLVCGKEFIPSIHSYSRQKYCSHNCSVKSQIKSDLNQNSLKNRERNYKKSRSLILKNPEKYREYHRIYQKEHREKTSIWTKKNTQQIRYNVLIKIGGDKGIICVKCGFSDIRALCIDHINGGGRDDRKDKHSPVKFYKYILSLTDEESRQKYQILCSNCNSIKRIEKKEHARPRT